MMNWYDNGNMMISTLLSEDAGAPELRNPRSGSMTSAGWLTRLVRKVFLANAANAANA